jgi:hypothetical protein
LDALLQSLESRANARLLIAVVLACRLTSLGGDLLRDVAPELVRCGQLLLQQGLGMEARPVVNRDELPDVVQQSRLCTNERTNVLT